MGARFSAVLASILLLALFPVLTHMASPAAKPVQGNSPPAGMASRSRLDLHGCSVVSVGVSGPWAELLRSSGVEVVDLEAVTGRDLQAVVEGFSALVVNISDPASQSNPLVDVIGREFLGRGSAVVFLSPTGLEIGRLESHLEAMLKDNSLVLGNIASGLGGKTCVTILEPDGSVKARYCTSSKKVYVFSLRLTKVGEVGDTGHAAPMVRVFSADPGAIVEEERLRGFLLETLSDVCGSGDK